MLKSDLQLNLKLAMSNIVKMAAGHMQPSMHNALILGNRREYFNKYSTAESVGVLQPLLRNAPRKLQNSVKLRMSTAITPFKVTQGHRFLYQSKAHIRLPISD